MRTADRGPRAALPGTGLRCTGLRRARIAFARVSRGRFAVRGSGTPARRGLGKPPDTRTENPGWTAFSYLLSGMIFYGGLGWIIGRWVVHSALFFPLGMVVGLALGVVLVILRFGRS